MASEAPRAPCFGTFLLQAMGVLADEAPPQLQALATALGPRAVRIEVDAEPAVWLRRPVPRDRRVWRNWVDWNQGPSAVEVRIAARDLLRILAGDTSIEASIVDGVLHVRGALDDVLAFHDALTAWLHGATRAPSFPKLLHELRSHYARPIGE